MSDSPPPYPGINANYTAGYPTQPNGFSGAQQPPPQMGFAAAGGGFAPSYPMNGQAGGYPSGPAPGYPGGSAPGYPSASYPNLPQNGFAGGFQPSAPSSKTINLKLRNDFNLIHSSGSHQTKEQEAAAYYDPRAPNSAFVQTPQFYENPPAYSELDHKKQQ